MDRYRIKQIMSVILFPYISPDLRSNDPLYQKYCEYNRFIQLSQSNATTPSERLKQNNAYKRAEQVLVEYLLGSNGGKGKSYDEVRQLCEFYFPLPELRRKLNRTLKEEITYEDISRFYILRLRDISESLITYRDGIAAIRTWSNIKNEDIFYGLNILDKVELWNILCRYTVPDIYIAIFAVDSGVGVEALYEQKPFISLADKLIYKYLQKGLAENHIHFNVGYDYEGLWIKAMELKRLSKKSSTFNRSYVGEEDCLEIQAAVFRCVAACFIADSNREPLHSFEQWIENNLDVEIRELLRFMEDGKCPNIPMDELKCLFGFLVSDEWIRFAIEGDYLLETVYKQFIELKTSSEILLLFFAYQYICESTKDTYFATLFLQYIRIKNKYFSNSIQLYEKQGLVFFQKYYNNAKLSLDLVVDNKEEVYLEVFRAQAKITSLKKLEIRIAPNIDVKTMEHIGENELYREAIQSDILKQLYHIFYAYRKFILENIVGVMNTKKMLEDEKRKIYSIESNYKDLYNEITFPDKMNVPTLGIVFHFLKAEYLDNISGFFCWKNINEDESKYSTHKFYERQKLVDIAVALEKLRHKITFLSEYIVGVDAASDENAMSPWMFAPAYKQIRCRENTRPVTFEENTIIKKFRTIQNIGFTYHVGEDFRHILSGLRHIDEVIQEFHYKPGDRLGHAIALGISIERWCQENEFVPIPIQEHMENLIWLWGKNVCEGISIPIQLEKLEEEIINLAEDIYINTNGITVRMLYQAYKLKFRNDHKNIMKKFVLSELKDLNMESKKRSFCYHYNEKCDIGYPQWDEEKLLCTNYCPVFEERFRKVCLIPIHKKDIPIYNTLQNALMERVETLGVYIETNPTSNMTIGDMDNFIEHPIFRMNEVDPNDGHHIMVTINSDDPAVFNTNVENEISYIYYAVEHGGYSKEAVLSWIDKIRQNGLDASFIQKIKTGKELFYEMSHILDLIPMRDRL